MFLRIANYAVNAVIIGLPLFYGFMGRGLHAPIICAACVTAYNLLTGWRLNRTAGLLGSVLPGLAFASAIIFALYFIGRWAGA
jgi:hypothetical protein